MKTSKETDHYKKKMHSIDDFVNIVYLTFSFQFLLLDGVSDPMFLWLVRLL